MFNWSELHLSEVTSYKIHTLVNLNSLGPLQLNNESFNDANVKCIILNFRCLARGAAAEVKRTDDNEESLKKRFATFTNATQPIIKHFDDKNMVKTINAERSVDEVWADVEKLFQ